MAHEHDLCRDCDRVLAECDWDGDSDLCDRCKANEERFAWLDETEAAVEKLADEHGWVVEEVQHARETASRYITLRKECDACVLASDDDCTCRTLKVRVSDHGSMYCSEDISIAMHASGDDHTIEALAKVLAK